MKELQPHRMFMRYDPEVGCLFVPGLQVRIPHWEAPFIMRTNRQGFRSQRDFSLRKSGRCRLLILGDSHAAGDGLENGQRFSDRLEARFEGLECCNLAVNGTGFDQQLLIYQKMSEMQHDAVCFAPHLIDIDRLGDSFYGRDPYTNELFSFSKPYFSIDQKGDLELLNVPVPLQRRPWKPSRKAAIRNLLTNRWTERIPARIAEFLLRAYWQKEYRYYDGRSPLWKLSRAIIGELIRQAGQRPVILCPLPDPRLGAHSRQRKRFQEIEQEFEHAAFVDLARHFKSYSRQERWRMHSGAWGHYSGYGHEAVAEALSRELADQGLVPSSKRQKAPAILTPRGSGKPQGGLSILGISAFYHDSACTLVRNGEIVAAAQEERFSRIKNDASFPDGALNYCLEEGRIHAPDVDAVVFYENPALSLERIVASLQALGPQGLDLWLRFAPRWINGNLQLRELLSARGFRGRLHLGYHHLSHAASAFLPSPFKEAAILTVDGVGEWATASIGRGQEGRIEILKEMHFPHSLGLLYSAFTSYLGFKVNEGEYKMMGLASYGEPAFADRIKQEVVDIRPDGSIRLNMDYFSFLAGGAMTNQDFHGLLGGPPRHPEAPLRRREMDLARSIQKVTEEIVLKMARHAKELSGCDHLCLAGGVALNCVANGELLRQGIFKDIWIQPAAGDAGGSLGAALWLHQQLSEGARDGSGGPARQGGSYWGPSYSDEEVRAYLESHGLPFHPLDPSKRAGVIADHIAAGKAVGHFSGRMEFGPRALGARSILADARSESTQSRLNLSIKRRESFRPFAPTVLQQDASQYFDLDRPSPYMLLVAPVLEKRRLHPSREEDIIRKVNQKRSDVPAITHVDYSARVQTLDRRDHGGYHSVIEEFKKRTGYGLVVNTSFNVKDEPIVCTPHDAVRCFLGTDMDVLILENQMLLKQDMPANPIPPEAKQNQRPAAPEDRLTPALQRSFRRLFSTDGQAWPPSPLCLDFRAPEAASYWVKGICRTGSRDLEAHQEVGEEADCILDSWQYYSPEQRERLRALVEELLRLRDRFADARAGLQSEISRSVYQMY